jgi:hypothetical protein
VAEIEADGPFSPFPGVDRCFAVLEGAGVELAWPTRAVRLTDADDALAFPGESAPRCRLMGGPTRDLNLMLRRGAGVARMTRSAPIGPSRWRGLYAGGTLHWTDDPREALPAVPGWHLAA